VELKREVLTANSVIATPAQAPFAAADGGALAPSEFRARQLRSRDMLRGALEGDDLERYVEEAVMTTTVEKAVGWAMGNSIYPLTFGLACCAIEMMSIVAARVDIARFGFEAFRASPRQADLIILSGRVSIKMAPVIRRIYDQMLEPKFAISMGACCSSMGVFNNYALVPSDKFLPIDVHVPGCPPRPEALAHGILRLRDKIQGNAKDGWRERYEAVGTEEVLDLANEQRQLENFRDSLNLIDQLGDQTRA
jgi:NADH-quinone oxidoreductase subunit B